MKNLIETKQEQLLKLVTKSFYNELVKFGINKTEMVSASVYLLDHIIEKHDHFNSDDEFYNEIFQIAQIKDQWENNLLSYNSISLKPLVENNITNLLKWLKTDEISETLTNTFPKDDHTLRKILLDTNHNEYFAIFADNIFLVLLVLRILIMKTADSK